MTDGNMDLRIFLVFLFFPLLSCSIIVEKTHGSQADVTLTLVTHQGGARTASDCVQQCLQYSPFECRAASYSRLESICRLHGNHPIEYAADVIASPGYRLYADSCPPGWTAYNTKCYLVETSLLSWDAAQAKCQSHGGGLIIIEDDGELNLSIDFGISLGLNVCLWIGGRWDSGDGQFRWWDGSAMISQGWASNRPNDWAGCVDNCNSLGWLWNDVPNCSTQLGYICETQKFY